MTIERYSLASSFSEQLLKHPDEPALLLDGQTLDYRALGDSVRRVAGWLTRQGVRPGARVGVLAARSLEAYAGILGACWAGCAWVPLNPGHPEQRLASLLERSQPDALVVDARGAEVAGRAGVPVLGPGLASAGEPTDAAPVWRGADDLAYLMFTSGTTGVPKGVMIAQAAIHHFLSVMQQRYGIGPGDRVSQFFELTFDLSLFDLFMSFGNGAALCVLPEQSRLGPAQFIAEQKLTVWFSVPSAMVLMHRFRQLQPGAFPHLRLSLFCGEPLPADPVASWRSATPNAVTENLYGPTEATLACLLEPCGEDLRVTPERRCVAIGRPYPDTLAEVVDAEGKPCGPGQPGELLLGGSQLAAGYWRDPGLTSERFVRRAGVRWYRTGDLAYRDEADCFHHLGRIDNQIKIFGHRVELEDIDAHLRQVCQCDTAMAVAWPIVHGSAQGVVAFVAGCDLSVAAIRDGMKRRVPEYMVPREVRFLDALPLSANGKFDRNALGQSLRKGSP
jgi:D-alanine--poly(phosphoribitol) ligase subunit 1